MYYKHYQTRTEPKLVPGVLILGILILVIGGFSLALKYRPTAQVQHDTSVIERVDSVNIRDSSVTVYWRTKSPTRGFVRYGTESENLGKEAYDERDVSTQLGARRNHVVTLPHLTHSKKIYFQLVVDDKPLGQSAGVPFMTQTLRPRKTPLDIKPLYGEVGRRSGDVEQDAVVIATIGRARPLLTQTHTDGTFLFSPCCLYDVSSGEPVYPSQEDSVRIEVISEDGTSKLIQAQLASLSPLKDPILVDVKDDITVLTDETTSKSKNISPSAENPEVLAASDSLIRYNSTDIIFPQQNMSIPGSRPLVRGVGVPGQIVRGRFVQMNRLFQVSVDKDRNWVYEPSFDFAAGGHTLIIDTVDEDGKQIHLTRAFSILKSGEAVLGNATDSATLTPTVRPSTTVTPSITVSLTPSPEATATASPTVISMTPTPPVSGFDILPFTMISLVLIVIGGAIVLLF